MASGARFRAARAMRHGVVCRNEGEMKKKRPSRMLIQDGPLPAAYYLPVIVSYRRIMLLT